MKNYNELIGNYYVGVLYISEPFNDLNKPSFKEMKNNGNYYLLKRSGAIDLGPQSYYINTEEQKQYCAFLTLFRRYENGYLCIHNGITYKENEIDANKLYLLQSFLPKVNYTTPRFLTCKEAKILFAHLFNKNMIYKMDTMYSNDEKNTYKKRNFKIGTFYLTTGYQSNNNGISKYEFINVPLRLMLEKNSIKFKKISDRSNLKGFEYISCQCLFLEQKDKCLNLNDNQYDGDEIVMQSYEDYADNNGILIPKGKINIKTALELTRKRVI